MYNAGQLRHRITFKKDMVEDDWVTDVGETSICSCWAMVTPLNGKAYWEAQAGHSLVTHEIVIRYRKDVDATMIIEYNGRQFDIDYMFDVDEKRKFLKINAKERH